MKTSEFLELLHAEGLREEDLAEALVRTLSEHSLRVASAESCTGGMISQRITNVSGASGVFDCGVCSYANFIKHKVLGVRDETLGSYGAVSEQTAREMARGVRLLSGADIAVSTTGIAGPLGGTRYKPVGLVYVGVSTEHGLKAHRLLLGENGADRRRIRGLASSAALYFALKEAQKLA